MKPPFAEDALSAVLFWSAVAIWGVPEIIGTFLQRAKTGERTRDRGSHAMIWIGTAVTVASANTLAFAFPAAAITWARPTVFLVGIALVVLGVAFRWYAIRVLGQYFTRDVTVRAGQQVVQSGPYRYVRHPSYSGTLLTMLGYGLALAHWAALGVMIVGGLLTFGYRIAVEEQALREGLGQAYEDYMRRTWRLIPLIY